MDVTRALAELTELSSQVESAVVLGAEGEVLGSTSGDDADVLARAAGDLVAAAGELHPAGGHVTRVEVELAEGAVFVLSEGGRTIVARTRPRPTAGLVAYDLRTCLATVEEIPTKRRRGERKPTEPGE